MTPQPRWMARQLISTYLPTYLALAIACTLAREYSHDHDHDLDQISPCPTHIQLRIPTTTDIHTYICIRTFPPPKSRYFEFRD
ncbi:hypothetical protein DFH27DRAFT_536593 [Peziza echinospora]|nr:hypothetical protein DFH27DRAFT_536593 [Peziza echinospora]